MDIYRMSYNDILSLNDDIREYYMDLFNKEIEQIDDSIYSPYKPLYQMICENEDILDSKVSEYFFEGEIINFYPIINTRKSLNNKVCHISGDIIYKNSLYVTYKAFLYNKQKKEAFVLKKPINVMPYYEFILPKTLKEFEEFAIKVRNSYDLNLEEYYNFYANYKSDISVRKLTI